MAPLGVERAHMPLARIHPLNSTTDPDPNDCLGVFPLVRLEGFEPPTLGSVGTFHSQQLGDSLDNLTPST